MTDSTGTLPRTHYLNHAYGVQSWLLTTDHKRNRRLYPLFKVLFSESNPVPVKMARHLLGRSGPTVRSPLVACTEGGREKIRAVLERLEVLTPVAAA